MLTDVNADVGVKFITLCKRLFAQSAFFLCRPVIAILLTLQSLLLIYFTLQK